MSVANILGADGKILSQYLPAGGGGGGVTNPLSESLDCNGYQLTNSTYVRTNVVECETLETKTFGVPINCDSDLSVSPGQLIRVDTVAVDTLQTRNGGPITAEGQFRIQSDVGDTARLLFTQLPENVTDQITVGDDRTFVFSAPVDVPYAYYSQQQGFPYPLYGTGNINPGLPINNGGFVGNLINIAPFQIFTTDFRKDLSPTGLYLIDLELYLYSTVNDVFEIGATSADVTTGFVEYPGQITVSTGSWCAALPGAVGGGNYRHTVRLQDYYDLNALPETALWVPLIIIKTTTVAGPVNLIGGRYSLSISPVK